MDPNVEVHPETLREKPPEFLVGFVNTVIYIITSFGWYVLGFTIVATYVWYNWLQEKYEKWLSEKEERMYAAKYHKDPDIARARQEHIDSVRRRMQEESDRKAAEFAEKQREREEARRREKEAERERLLLDGGRRLNDNSQETGNNDSRPSFRQEYNPLMGAGGAGGYRPPRRGGCPGGGCNR